MARAIRSASTSCPAGATNRDTHKTPYRLVLRGREGTKELGVLWKIDVDSGEAPLSKPTLVGLLRSPYEPRVAVLFRQLLIATEGAQLTMIRILGGRLDRGWRTPPPPQ